MLTSYFFTKFWRKILALFSNADSIAHLIIGKTTDSSTTIWVRSERKYPWAHVWLNLENNTSDDKHKVCRSITKELPEGYNCKKVDPTKDYIAIVPFEGLRPDTVYRVEVHFTKSKKLSRNKQVGGCEYGSFRTFPSPECDVRHSFSFLLGSCNLSVYTINSLVARLIGMVGLGAFNRALKECIWTWDRPKFSNKIIDKLFDRLWRFERVRLLISRVSRCIGKGSIMFLSWFVSDATKGRQPGKPIIKSPFLKLSALFDSSILNVERMKQIPSVGDEIRGSKSGATGTLAYSPVMLKSVMGQDEPRHASRSLILTNIRGEFQPDEDLYVSGKALSRSDANELLGTSSGTATKLVKTDSGDEKPAFVLHAGDQIYFDFPYRDRLPTLKEYRRSYQEAWVKDESLRFFLAQYPHFMMLDDHEIYDQYKVDGETPDKRPMSDYAENAQSAYKEYVHSRQSNDDACTFYYTFHYKNVHYFVLDIRTERKSHAGEMISKTQMKAFLKWLDDHKDDLKFVVSSVPFIAEVLSSDESKKDPAEEPQAKKSASSTKNRNDDKWCGTSYRAQREKIIKHIYQTQISKLVFLVGDMHCTYHATMQIGEGRGYHARIIHELAGGPFNQLQLSKQESFQYFTQQDFIDNDGKVVPYVTRLERFYNGTSAVLHITVNDVPSKVAGKDLFQMRPEIEWKVLRTLTDSSSRREDKLPQEVPAMYGRIRFIERERINGVKQ